MTDQIPIIVFHSRDYAIHSQVAFVQKLTCPFIAKSLGLEWIGVKHRKEMIMETVRIWDLSYLQTQQNISPVIGRYVITDQTNMPRNISRRLFGFQKLTLPSECSSDTSTASCWHILSYMKRSKRGEYLELGLLLPVSRDPTASLCALKRSFIKRKISSKEHC